MARYITVTNAAMTVMRQSNRRMPPAYRLANGYWNVQISDILYQMLVDNDLLNADDIDGLSELIIETIQRYRRRQ